MSAIGPGDLVECIESYGHGEYGLAFGRIYTVTEVVPSERLGGPCSHGPRCEAGGALVREAPCPPGYYWCASCFRPVGRPADGLIRMHTDPVRFGTHEIPVAA